MTKLCPELQEKRNRLDEDYRAKKIDMMAYLSQTSDLVVMQSLLDKMKTTEEDVQMPTMHDITPEMVEQTKAIIQARGQTGETNKPPGERNNDAT